MHNKLKIQFSIYEDSTSLESFILNSFDISKSKLKKMKLKKAFLNKALRKKDCIELDADIVNNNRIKLTDKSEVNILMENESVIAVSKPHQYHSHPLSYNETDNVLSHLFQKRLDLKNINGQSYDRGLLYRLDFETSGLILYAKTNAVFKDFRANFKTLAKTKEYIAIVNGKTKEHMQLEDYLDASGAKGHKVIVSDYPTDKLATLSLETLQYNSKEDLSLVKVKLNEGHRHQIRVQLSNAGFPILGDELYGNTLAKRLYLHCYRYDIAEVEYKDNSLELFDLFFDLDGKL